ncbi:MAG: efflux RND transporter periplasmic adaptor subunit, partial [Nitrospiraceae bacterium]
MTDNRTITDKKTRSTTMRIQCRTIWIAAGLLGVILIGGWLLHEPIRDRLFSQTDGPAHSRQMEHPQGEHGVSGPQSRMPAGTGPSQASAMVSPAKQQLIGVTTAMVEKRPLGTVIRAVGRVEYDEQRIAHVNLRISGWVQDLFVDYTGQFVRKSQPLLTLYSPELVASQDEYLLALRTLERVKDSPLDEAREQAERMVESARERLRLWTLTDQQLEEIARRGKARTSITIVSPAGGYVIDKQVFKGMYVEPQMTVYRIADLSRVWINAEIYEFEVPFVQVGQPAEVTISSYPGEMFRGRVSYIYPYLNEQTRTVKVRLDLANPDLRLKPDMYGNILINVDRGTRLAVPEQAVLDSGTKTMVFLVRGEGLFEPREVTLGPKIGSFYEVQEGLRAGDRVVTS